MFKRMKKKVLFEKLQKDNEIKKEEEPQIV